MHNEPGYPLKGWLIPPHIFTCPEAQALVKSGVECEVEPYSASNLDVMPKRDKEKLIKAENAAARKASNKASGRPKSESEVEKYFPRIGTAQSVQQSGL